MLTLAEVLGQILNRLSQLAGILGIIQGQTTKAAQENAPFEIDTTTQEIFAIVEDSTFGNQALRNTIDTNATLATAQYDDLVARIALLQQAADPVVLPTTPPAGYGGTLTPADIWLYPIGSRGFVAEEFLSHAGTVAMNLGGGGAIPAAGTGPFTLEDGFDNPNAKVVDRGPPVISPLSILPDDTLYSWLQREWPVTELWSFNTEGQFFFYLDDYPEGDIKWVCTLSDAEFQALKSGGVVPALLANVPPVWPGLDLVTLGSTTALAPQMTITEACDGVIVLLDSVSANKTFFPYGGVNGYRGIGALSFFDDNGEQETYQPLMFTDQVYCCLAMSHAAGVRLRVDPSVSGTIQLWSITPT